MLMLVELKPMKLSSRRLSQLEMKVPVVGKMTEMFAIVFLEKNV